MAARLGRKARRYPCREGSAASKHGDQRSCAEHVTEQWFKYGKCQIPFGTDQPTKADGTVAAADADDQAGN